MADFALGVVRGVLSQWGLVWLTRDGSVSFLFLIDWCTIQPGSAVLSLVFCVGEANDLDLELVAPEVESTSSITSTGGGVYSEVVWVLAPTRMER